MYKFKKYLFLFLLSIGTLNLLAQNKLVQLENEIKFLATENYKINSISIQKDSNWQISYGDNGFSASSIDSSEFSILKQMNKNGEKVHQILKIDSIFIVVYGNKFECINCPKSIKNNLIRIQKRKEYIQNIFYKDNIYSIIHNNYELTTNLPNYNIANKLFEIQAKGLKVKQVISFKNAWLISYGKAGISAFNMQKQLLSKLNEIKKQNKQIDFIYPYKNSWFIIYDKNQLKKIDL